MSKIKIGLLGVGHLGKIHLNCLRQLPNNFEIVGFYDPNKDLARKVSQDSGIQCFTNLSDLLECSDAVDIVTPTVNHLDCALQAIDQACHIFIEKPLVATPKEADTLKMALKNTNLKVQVGHVERFNPAFLSVKDRIKQPMFIETHRLAQFNPRGTDVPVVLDLMIHDLDIVLHTVRSEIKHIHASGVSIVSDTPDIANVRLEFENGCVANLTSSRISMKNMRKTRFFQSDAYISVDFLDKKSEVVSMTDMMPGEEDPFAMVMEIGDGKPDKKIIFNTPRVVANNAIVEELNSFALAIQNNTQPVVDLEDGYKALYVAHRIVELIDKKA